MVSGPMMKLVYKLQAEDYKFDFPVSYLPVSKLWDEHHAQGSGQSALHSGCSGAGGVGLGGCGCGQEKTMVSAQGLGGIIPDFAQGEGTMRPGLSLAEWQVGLCDSYSVFLSLQPSGAN